MVASACRVFSLEPLIRAPPLPHRVLISPWCARPGSRAGFILVPIAGPLVVFPALSAYAFCTPLRWSRGHKGVRVSKNPTAGGRQSDDADGGRDDTGDLRLRLVRGMLWTALGLIMLVRLLSAWQEELPWSAVFAATIPYPA